MRVRIRQVHRMLVERIAESGLVARAWRPDASWTHYGMHHGPAGAPASALHARAGTGAGGWPVTGRTGGSRRGRPPPPGLTRPGRMIERPGT